MTQDYEPQPRRAPNDGKCPECGRAVAPGTGVRFAPGLPGPRQRSMPDPSSSPSPLRLYTISIHGHPSGHAHAHLCPSAHLTSRAYRLSPTRAIRHSQLPQAHLHTPSTAPRHDPRIQTTGQPHANHILLAASDNPHTASEQRRRGHDGARVHTSRLAHHIPPPSSTSGHHTFTSRNSARAWGLPWRGLGREGQARYMVNRRAWPPRPS